MTSMRPKPRDRLDLATAFFGKNVSADLSKSISKGKQVAEDFAYGPLVGHSALVAHTLERNLQEFAGTPDFSEHLQAHKTFTGIIPDYAAKSFLVTRLGHFKEIHEKVLSGEIQKEAVPGILSKMSVRHAQAFEKYSAALEKENHIQTEKWRRAMEAALDREKYREITRGS